MHNFRKCKKCSATKQNINVYYLPILRMHGVQCSDAPQRHVMQKVQQHKICNTLPHEMQKVQCTKAISVTSYLTWGYVPYYMLCIKLNLQFSAKQSKKMPSQDALYTRMNCNTETYSPMHQFALLMQFHRPKKCAGLDIFKSIFFFKKISVHYSASHNNEHHHCLA